MRLALAHPSSWPEVRRGGERVLHDLAWALRHEGHEVEIVSGIPGPRDKGAVEDVPVTWLHHRARLDRRGLTRYETFGLEAFPWLAAHRFDVVVAMAPTVAIASRLAGHRTVFAPMGWPTAQHWADRPVEARAFRLAARLAHAVTVLSSPVADSVTMLTGRRPTVLPPGVRLEQFPVTPGPRQGPPIVLFASWAEERGKGLDLLVEAFLLLLERDARARLWLAGGGAPDWALQGLTARDRRRVTKSVEVVAGEGTPITPAVYGAAHVTALPSRMESFGLVLVESLACGTPVVASAVGGILDAAGGCQQARLVPHGDVPALEAALVEAIVLAGDPATAQEARTSAARFDWAAAVASRHAAFYRSVASTRPTSPASA